MAQYRLLNHAGPDGGARPGILVDGAVIDLAEAGVAGSTLELLGDWDAASRTLRDTAGLASSLPSRPLGSVRLLAPILHPPAIYCAGANYVDHQKEMSGGDGLDKGATHPYFFLKSGPHCVIGPDAAIPLPRVSDFVDWEAELAVVIGKPARDVRAADALDHVAGYTILNDVSARDSKPVGRPFNVHWFAHKNFEGSAPMGPWITPAEDVPDPHDIDIRLWVNDDLKQDSNTRHMFFDIGEQIEYISARVTMLPGDVVATGTPSGVGMPYGGRLKAGDTVTIELAGLGRLANPVAAVS